MKMSNKNYKVSRFSKSGPKPRHREAPSSPQDAIEEERALKEAIEEEASAALSGTSAPVTEEEVLAETEVTANRKASAVIPPTNVTEYEPATQGYVVPGSKAPLTVTPIKEPDHCADCDNCVKEDKGCENGCASKCSAATDPTLNDTVGPLRAKLHAFNYLEDIPGGFADDDMVEVQFKNTRKGFFLNSTHIPLEIGDMVAVEAQSGHDVGMVSMIGALVRLQMRKANVKANAEVRRVFRKAKPADMERYYEARARENETMIRARKIASSLQLDMKIGDVEYQGDCSKAIFYYIADERVDFRVLIRVLAETFKVRIEMKQIGARQEAGRIGGIGPCGRPLCCTTWLTNFVSVSTAAARFQDLSLNPQKLAGQCAKLKCCLNFEVDTYAECSRKLPPRDVRLETTDATYYYFKADILRKEIAYSTDRNSPSNLVILPAERAFEIIAMNKRGEKPDQLVEKEEKPQQAAPGFVELVGQDSLTRFDKKKRKKSGKSNKPRGEEQKTEGEQKTPQEQKTQSPAELENKNRQRKDGPRPPKGENKPRTNGNGQGKSPSSNPSPKKQGGNTSQGNRQTENPSVPQSSPSPQPVELRRTPKLLREPVNPTTPGAEANSPDKE